MKVVVDLKLCEGNMKCQEAAPEVFEVRDDDKSHLLIGQAAREACATSSSSRRGFAPARQSRSATTR